LKGFAVFIQWLVMVIVQAVVSSRRQGFADEEEERNGKVELHGEQARLIFRILGFE
jgi:hypothetical protein